MKGRSGKGGPSGGKEKGGTMSLLQFFKPRTGPVVREIAVTATRRQRDDGDDGEEEGKRRRLEGEGREWEEFATPVKRPRGGEEGAGLGPACGAEEERTPKQEAKPAARRRGPDLARLGTPAQTYSRRKRPRVEELPSSPVANEEVGEPRPGGPVPTKLRQAYLDLGQSNFGPVKCPTCGLLYTIGEPTDERTHRQFHKKFLSSRGQGGWKEGEAMAEGEALVVPERA
ncbi:hypothetical protein A3770_01p04580 [Chloropicon primus]|uniref:N-acetyltransferase ESCO zinc-finger domain-containing protein n=1 Tax=Chloropicon primus TaxID=1764295 RepID=A0A5B8MF93_9CHLO|nr:hypothetical protein A3770_01p04580 [Chloropicon primus]|eukprot:QDZ17940.1 hypothetical protein A3770_01p04580 [Chloropicon primus]